MKKVNLLIAIAITASIAFAQPQTLLSGDLVSGGFGGPEVSFTQINDKLAVFTGGYGAWLLSHSIMLGGGGLGLVNEVKIQDLSADTAQYLGMGYGGAMVGYIHAPNNLVHFSVSTLIGGGNIDFQNRPTGSAVSQQGDRARFNHDSFWVLEPTVRAELNIISFLRFGVGASYRYVDGLENGLVFDSDLSGPSASASLMFGRF